MHSFLKNWASLNNKQILEIKNQNQTFIEDKSVSKSMDYSLSEYKNMELKPIIKPLLSDKTKHQIREIYHQDYLILKKIL